MQIQYLEPGASDYRAGACNIGPREIEKRRRTGIIGVAAAFSIAAILVAIDAPPIARAIVLLPLWGGLISLEQARRRFCVAFAFAGIRSANPAEARESVADPADLAADRSAARVLVLYCGLIALVITAALVLLPL